MEVARGGTSVYKVNQTSVSNQKVTSSNEKIEKAETSTLIEVEKKVEELNAFIKTTNSYLKFELHEDLNQYYVTLVDNETHEVVKEIPSKKILDLHATIREMIGIIIDKKR